MCWSVVRNDSRILQRIPCLQNDEKTGRRLNKCIKLFLITWNYSSFYMWWTQLSSKCVNSSFATMRGDVTKSLSSPTMCSLWSITLLKWTNLTSMAPHHRYRIIFWYLLERNNIFFPEWENANSAKFQVQPQSEHHLCEQSCGHIFRSSWCQRPHPNFIPWWFSTTRGSETGSYSSSKERFVKF